MSCLDDDIQRITQMVVEKVHPVRIILFGSAVRNPDQAVNDIDLLIVLPDGSPKRKTAQRLYKDLRWIRKPFDLLVTTESELEHHRMNAGLIYKTILEEGREIYVV